MKSKNIQNAFQRNLEELCVEPQNMTSSLGPQFSEKHRQQMAGSSLGSMSTRRGHLLFPQNGSQCNEMMKDHINLLDFNI